MANPANNGVVIGHLAADPKFIPHANGKTGTALLTIYAQDNYVTKSTGKRESVRIDLEDFIVDRNNVGPYSFLKKGMLVTASYRVANADYTDANGEKRYGIKLQVERGGLQVLESKTATAAREQRAAQAPAADAGQVQTFGDMAQAQGAQPAPQASQPAQAQTYPAEAFLPSPGLGQAPAAPAQAAPQDFPSGY